MHLFRYTTTTCLLTTTATLFPRSTSAFGLRRSLLAPLTTASMTSTTTTASTSTTARSVARTALDESGKDGAFVRKDSTYRNWIRQDPESKYPAEADRYHLYVSYACPWAHRTLMFRALKGLTDVISVTVVHPVWQKTHPESDEHAGWMFGTDNDNSSDGTTEWTNHHGNGGPFALHYPDTTADPYLGAKSIREVYEAVNDQDGKYTVPILFDTKTKTIVNNESSEIIRMLNTEFNALAKNPDLDLYPEDMRDAIEKVNAWVYPNLNNGVYRCGFAKTQSAYDKAIAELTQAFDQMDSILQKQRYIAGDRFTEADVRLFVTLVRFDEVYTVYFKTNTRSITHTPAVLNYCREIYQMPGVKETVNMEHIKTHYYCSHPTLNYYSIIPKGADFEKLLQEPHDRDAMAVKGEESVSNKRMKV